MVFLGFRRDVAKIMHSSDILVIPSIWEGFGLIAAEGMACGLPIAASNVPGLAEIVGDVGLKFEPEDPDSIKTAISSLYQIIDEGEMTARLQKRAKDYDINKTVQEYLAVYKKLARNTDD